MRVSREQALLNRQRVIEMAGQMFRERGFEGVGIADIMKAAGLTHGGFYAQFPSKEHLMAEAAAQAYEEVSSRWRERLDQASQGPLAALASLYLCADHRDHPGAGCVAATLGADVARQGARVRSRFTDTVKRELVRLAQRVAGRSPRARRRKAIAGFAAMVGGMVLARGVNDEALSDEILDAVRAHVADMDETLSG